VKQYVDLVKKVLAEGEERLDRTGTGTQAIFGGMIEFDLRDSFPLVTIKKTLWKSAFIEMLWFLRGEPNTKFLKEHGVNIWDDWADKEGNLGPVYGVQWRKWPGKLHNLSLSEVLAIKADVDHPLYSTVTFENHIGMAPHRADNGDAIYIYQERIDQVKQLISKLKSSPTGRRHIVTAWNVPFLDQMGLPPCHRDFQCYVSNDGHLDLMMSQRSWDLGLGAPFNIAQYALLTHLIGRATNLKPRKLQINYGDAHLYCNHVQPMKDWLDRYEVIDCKPQLEVNTYNVDIDGYRIADFDITGYESNPFLKLPIAV
jgi:thymidylate synthase